MLGPVVPGSSRMHEFDRSVVSTLLSSILTRVRYVLAEDAEIEVRDVSLVESDVDKLHLHNLTVLAGLGAPVNVLVAFSFEDRLVEGLFAGMARGLDLNMEDADLYKGECAAEAINMVLGLSTADLQSEDMTISLSPPVVLDNTRWIHRHRNAHFARMRLDTDHGVLDVNVVGPRELFDDRMNYTL
ncbi:MAG: chemotaxis protein CheX [Rhodospirillum sp.]|nr:chemotaxis protein CheX [Rhodospirillum sp.]MCF8492089.1 chemotaxis protein CheX [Rhodospirillum sp.]MCF8501888.1 chemotaxis protein CheX [Rhodospirillum sp.]